MCFSILITLAMTDVGATYCWPLPCFGGTCFKALKGIVRNFFQSTETRKILPNENTKDVSHKSVLQQSLHTGGQET